MVGGQPPPPDPNENPSGIATTSGEAHEEETQKEETKKAEAQVQEQQQPRFNPARLLDESRLPSSSSGHIKYFRKKSHILNAEKGDRQTLNDASLQEGDGLSRDLYNTRINLEALVAERRRKAIEEGQRASQLGVLSVPTSESQEEQTRTAADQVEVGRRRKSTEEGQRASQQGGLSIPTSESHEETRTAADQVGVPEQPQRRNSLGEAPRKSPRLVLLEEKRQSTSRLGRIEELHRAVETRASPRGGLSVPTPESHEEVIRTAGDQVGVPEQVQRRNPLGEATRKSPRLVLLEEKRQSTSRLGRIEELHRAVETRASQLGGLNVPTSESHEEETRTAGDQVGVPGQAQRRNPLGEAPRKSARIASLEEKGQSTSRPDRIEELPRALETPEHEKEELRKLNDKLAREKKSLSFEIKQLRRAVEIGKRDREDLQDLNNTLVQNNLELSGELNSQRENAEQTLLNGQVREEDREDLQKRNNESVQNERLSREVDSQREGAGQFHQQLRQCEEEKVDLHNRIHDLFQENERLSLELKQFHLDVQTRKDLQNLNDVLVQEKETLSLELNSQKEKAEQFRQALQILKQEKEDGQRLNNMILETSERLSIQIYDRIFSRQLNSQTENAEASPERGGQSLENKLKDVTVQTLVSSIRELKELLTTLKFHEAANLDLRNKNRDLHKKNESLMRDKDILELEKVETLERRRYSIQECIDKIQELTRRSAIDILKVTLYDHLVEENQINTSYPDLVKVMANQATDIHLALEHLKVLAGTVTSILAEEDPSKKGKGVLYIE